MRTFVYTVTVHVRDDVINNYSAQSPESQMAFSLDAALQEGTNVWPLTGRTIVGEGHVTEVRDLTDLVEEAQHEDDDDGWFGPEPSEDGEPEPSEPAEAVFAPVSVFHG
jgi:hypothetical protein